STAQTVNSGLANANDNFGIIAATCDSDAAGTVLKEYVPGRLAVPRSDTVTGARTLLSTASWWIGSDPDSATDGNPIEIAMVAIFNRAITSEEVDAISDYLRNGWYGPRLGGVMLP
ncbi:MAG: hypothetical protein U1D69_12770, partial [Polynucleobacter sp.]|nr:hypothetical protein [Polynucleobacter sp.]